MPHPTENREKMGLDEKASQKLLLTAKGTRKENVYSPGSSIPDIEAI